MQIITKNIHYVCIWEIQVAFSKMFDIRSNIYLYLGSAEGKESDWPYPHAAPDMKDRTLKQPFNGCVCSLIQAGLYPPLPSHFLYAFVDAPQSRHLTKAVIAVCTPAARSEMSWKVEADSEKAENYIYLALKALSSCSPFALQVSFIYT